MRPIWGTAMPKLTSAARPGGQDLTIRTWLRPPGAAVVTRDFQMLVGNSQVGQGVAHWITISERHRGPIALGFPDRPELFRQQGHPEHECSRE